MTRQSPPKISGKSGDSLTWPPQSRDSRNDTLMEPRIVKRDTALEISCLLLKIFYSRCLLCMSPSEHSISEENARKVISILSYLEIKSRMAVLWNLWKCAPRDINFVQI